MISFMAAVLWNLFILYSFQTEEYFVSLKYVILYFWKKNTLSNFKVWHPRCVLIQCIRVCKVVKHNYIIIIIIM